MMIKSPSEYNQNSKRFTILSDNFSKINVKQAVALQSGLGQGGMLNRDLSKVTTGPGGLSNAYGISQYPESGDRHVPSSSKRGLLRFTRDKRPVSSHNPPGMPRVRKGPHVAGLGTSVAISSEAAGPQLLIKQDNRVVGSLEKK